MFAASVLMVPNYPCGSRLRALVCASREHQASLSQVKFVRVINDKVNEKLSID